MADEDFYKVDLDNEWSTVQGAGRLLIADEDEDFPAEINDIIVTASGVNQYDAQTGWQDLGATLGGITLATNHAEETLGVDQVLGDIDSYPTDWSANVNTQLAENTLEHFQLAWEGSDISINTAPDVDEREIGFGQPTEYSRRRLAVLFKNRRNDLIRAYVFRKVQLQPVESQIAFNKTGDQQVIPVQLKALADATISNVRKRLFVVYEQVGS